MKKRRSKSKPLPGPFPAAAPLSNINHEFTVKALIEEECRALGIDSWLIAQDLVGHCASLQFRGETDAVQIRTRALTATL